MFVLKVVASVSGLIFLSLFSVVVLTCGRLFSMCDVDQVANHPGRDSYSVRSCLSSLSVSIASRMA